MKFVKYLFLVFCISGFTTIQAQDFHNSYVQFAPMTINPALTGAFYGNLRASIIGRDQGRPVAGSGNQFQDLNIFLDGSVNFGLTEGDWISVGMNVARSNVGLSDFKRRFQGISLAYHYAYGKRKDKVLTLGGKYGTYTSGFENGCADCQTTFNLGNPQGIDLDKGQFGSSTLNDASDYMVGLMLTTPMGKTADMRIGIAMDHIFSPRLTPASINNVPAGMDTIPVPIAGTRIDRRINGFVSLYTSISDKLTFNPNLYYQKMGVSTNILLQGLFSLMFNEEKEISFNAGLGIRVANSMDVPIYLGVDIKDLRVGLSYDTNISGLRPSNSTFGALELGVSKIFSWNKKATVKPVFICPRL